MNLPELRTQRQRGRFVAYIAGVLTLAAMVVGGTISLIVTGDTSYWSLIGIGVLAGPTWAVATWIDRGDYR